MDLYIRHHFNGLADRRYEIVWPEMSTERSCYIKETACSRLDEKLTAFVDGKIDRQSIMYVIPKNEPMLETFLFKAPFAELHGASVGSRFFTLRMKQELADYG